MAAVNQAVNALGKIFLVYCNFAATVHQYIVVSVLGLRVGFLCFLCVLHVGSSHTVFCFVMCEAFLLAGRYQVFTSAVQCSGWASST